MTKPANQTKPRVRFCWECGAKLYGNHFAEKMIEGYMKVLHKECAKALETGRRTKLRDDEMLESQDE
jgi:hypothetical protein